MTEQRNNRFSSNYFDRAVAEMAERTGDDRTQNNVQQATERFNLNPPD